MANATFAGKKIPNGNMLMYESNVISTGGALYATDVLLAQIVQYKQNFGWYVSIFSTYSS